MIYHKDAWLAPPLRKILGTSFANWKHTKFLGAVNDWLKNKWFNSFSGALSGLLTSCLRVISPEVMSSETWDRSPEIKSHAAQFLSRKNIKLNGIFLKSVNDTDRSNYTLGVWS